MNKLIQKEAKRLSQIRFEMLQAHPFWGYLLLQVRLIPAPSLTSIAATDCIRRIWYNPNYTRHLSEAQLGFVLAHEVGHQVYATATRQGRRNAHLWNCATDYAINRIISKIGHPLRSHEKLYTLPDGDYPDLGSIKILLDDKFEGMVAEVIYERLDDECLPQPANINLVLPNSQTDQEASNGGEDETFQLPNLSDHGGGIDIHLPDTLNAQDYEELEQRLSQAVNFWKQQSNRGNIPAQELQFIKFADKPRVDWKSQLQHYAQTCLIPDEYTLTRPNRRYLALDFIVPGLRGERVPHIAVSIDTSGSMSQEMIEEVGQELRHLSNQVERLTLIVADQEVIEVIEDGDLERFFANAELSGGRGTDHRPVFSWIEEQASSPDIYIGMTDLYSRFPSSPPHYPVLWLTPYDDCPKPPWGTVIHIQNEGDHT